MNNLVLLLLLLLQCSLAAKENLRYVSSSSQEVDEMEIVTVNIPPMDQPSTYIPSLASEPSESPTDNPFDDTPFQAALWNTPISPPTEYPTESPTPQPSYTDSPTNYPSHHPSYYPTVFPTARPTFTPTFRPTSNPSHPFPTHLPSEQPTSSPTRAPTAPTMHPTLNGDPGSDQFQQSSLYRDLPQPNEHTIAQHSYGQDLFPFSSQGPLKLHGILGRWFQTQGSLFLNPGRFCITVDYDLKSNLHREAPINLRVIVSARLGSPTGRLSQVIGTGTNRAYGLDPIPGILYGIYGLNTNQMGDVLNPGIFVVQKVGPIDVVNKQYAWMAVSDPTKSFLFILARDVPTYKRLYERGAIEYLLANGFDRIWNMPTDVYQSDICRYFEPTIFV